MDALVAQLHPAPHPHGHTFSLSPTGSTVRQILQKHCTGGSQGHPERAKGLLKLGFMWRAAEDYKGDDSITWPCPVCPHSGQGAACQYSHPFILLMKNPHPASVGTICVIFMVADPFCSQHTSHVGSAGRQGFTGMEFEIAS